jgi:cell shape-determining protein MreC
MGLGAYVDRDHLQQHLRGLGHADQETKDSGLLTSGLGGVYPKDIVVGEVTSVSAPQTDLFAAVSVVSRVDIDRIEEVLVIVGSASVTAQPGGGE